MFWIFIIDKETLVSSLFTPSFTIDYAFVLRSYMIGFLCKAANIPILKS